MILKPLVGESDEGEISFLKNNYQSDIDIENIKTRLSILKTMTSGAAFSCVADVIEKIESTELMLIKEVITVAI